MVLLISSLKTAGIFSDFRSYFSQKLYFEFVQILQKSAKYTNRMLVTFLSKVMACVSCNLTKYGGEYSFINQYKPNYRALEKHSLADLRHLWQPPVYTKQLQCSRFSISMLFSHKKSLFWHKVSQISPLLTMACDFDLHRPITNLLENLCMWNWLFLQNMISSNSKSKTQALNKNIRFCVLC